MNAYPSIPTPRTGTSASGPASPMVTNPTRLDIRAFSCTPKGSSINNGRKSSDVRENGVVPLAVERIATEVEGVHLLIRDFEARRIGVRIQIARDGETRCGGRGGNQVEDHGIADQRLAAPILTDEGEESVLDLVPLARPRREVADSDRHAGLVGQPLKFAFP